MYCRSNSATCCPFLTMTPAGATLCRTSMKSFAVVLPPPVPPGSESDVLPRPLDPNADEVDVELDELDEDEELEPEELPKRLVAAVNAEVAFGAEVETLPLDELEELDEELLEEDETTELEESRPASLRLPVKRGVMREAKLAAPVTPVRRSVRSTGPGTILAIRIPAGFPGPPPDDVACLVRSQSVTPAPTITRSMTRTIHRRDPRRLPGCGCTTSGRATGDCGDGDAGAGDALIEIMTANSSQTFNFDGS